MSIKLSKRLQTIASFISSNSLFADIGSDHAYLPCYVCLSDQTVQAIAGEVKEGPLKRAQETVEYYDLSERIDVRLGNGLQIINENDHVNEVVIAGMGGSLIANIMEEGKNKLSAVHKIIAQPNIHASSVRKTFLANNYSLINEIILMENNHIYEVLVAERDSTVNIYDPAEHLGKQLMFGPLLMQEKSPVFIKKWQDEREKLLHITSNMEKAKNKEETKLHLYKKQLQWMEEVLT
ncbi:tRNA (adenine(22)-N(1))-methyltransferase [Pseudogracilibacillus auburnensis]|uniref:tRNA (adenine(22)-N(1))-methyltransferase n=1 Tax=Pseudogracilibacillus auburnensis TaxID=1494959 RepID=UPI001A96B091|nr:tRNA (adenine(22)-N(1))-methyltransferase TrmK [Pseudogracilibacillus auburnensis]MBO1003503.1 tRNA (adenine(22)-N(1))-methyltransferase TrmK [Pseudogracilibacillus auburnensis]